MVNSAQADKYIYTYNYIYIIFDIICFYTKRRKSIFLFKNLYVNSSERFLGIAKKTMLDEN